MSLYSNNTTSSKKRKSRQDSHNVSINGTANISRFFLPLKRKGEDQPLLTERTCSDSTNLEKQQQQAGESVAAGTEKEVVDLLSSDDDDDDNGREDGAMATEDVPIGTTNDEETNVVTVTSTTEVKDTADHEKIADPLKELSARESTTSNSQSSSGTTDNKNNSKSTNPFAMFAFRGDGSSSASEHENNGVGVSPFTSFRGHSSSSKAETMKNRSTNKDVLAEKSGRSKTQEEEVDDQKQKQKKKQQQKPWVKMKDYSVVEQERILQKWHSLVDPSAPLEDKRFQMLVAARLHARCQDKAVRKAMQELRNFFETTKASTLTVQTMAKISPDDFVPAIQNLQYYNTKAKHLVLAANEIQCRFDGLVPETEHSLKQITGIGPVMADLLAFINTRLRHEQVKVISTEAVAAQLKKKE